MSTSHPLVLGLFDDETSATSAARALRELGIPRERVSIVARTHEVEGVLADASGGSPGSEIEDSPVASRAGQLGAYVIAAVAIVLPGIGPIVAGGPLAAGLGEAAGHLAGGVGKALEQAGFDEARAEQWESRIRDGAILIGAHVDRAGTEDARRALSGKGATEVSTVQWPGALE